MVLEHDEIGCIYGSEGGLKGKDLMDLNFGPICIYSGQMGQLRDSSGPDQGLTSPRFLIGYLER